MRQSIRPAYGCFIFATIGAITLFLLDPSEFAFTPRCPFKMLTGWSCPGCGLQRAVHSALHGDFIQAIHYNFFLLLSLPFAAGLIFTEWCLPKGKGESLHKYLNHKYTIYTYIVLFIVWGIVRNIIKI